MALAVLVLVVVYGPKLYYAVFLGQATGSNSQSANQAEQQFVTESKAQQQQTQPTQEAHQPEQEQKYLPPKDENLPAGEWLIIPKIGVNSQLQRTENEHDALNSGLWWVPDFGKPGDLDKPMIVAGHRFGWKWWWQSDYWQKHSFYRLPELQPGDIVEVIADQRKWQYKIYQAEEGVEITDYDANLILYTCKHLNSPIRYFRYARLLIEK
jgi:sortase (surface protein transpeptidase)